MAWKKINQVTNQTNHPTTKKKQNRVPQKKIQLSTRTHLDIALWAQNELKQRTPNNTKKKKKRRINNRSLDSKTTGDEGATTLEQLEKEGQEIISTIEQIEAFLVSCTDIKTRLESMDSILRTITNHGHSAFFKQDNAAIWDTINRNLQDVASLIQKNWTAHNQLLKKIKTTKRILTHVQNNPISDNFDKLLNHYNSFFPNEQSVSLSELKEYIQEQFKILKIKIKIATLELLQFLEKYYKTYSPLALQKLDEIKKYFDEIKQDVKINFETLNKFLEDINLIGSYFALINSSDLEKITKEKHPQNKEKRNNKTEEEEILGKLSDYNPTFNLKNDYLNMLLLEKTKYFRQSFDSLTKKIGQYEQRVEYRKNNKNHQLSQNQDNPIYPLFPEREKLVQEMINGVNVIKKKITEIQRIMSYYPKKWDGEKKHITAITKQLRIKEKNLTDEMEFIKKTQNKAREYIQQGFCPICHNLSTYKCSRCRRVFYCSLEHQRNHWAAHKKRCSSTEPLYFIANLIRDDKIAFFDNKRTNLPNDTQHPEEFILGGKKYILKINNLYGPIFSECGGKMQYPVYFDEGAAREMMIDSKSEPPLNLSEKTSVAFSHLAYTMLQE